MKAFLIASVTSLAIGAGGAWYVQDKRYGEEISGMKLSSAIQLAKAHESALKDYQELEKIKDDAIKKQAELLDKQAASAAAARADSDRLRRDIAGLPGRIDKATRSAVDEFAKVASGLLGDCTREYIAMAEVANRHAAGERLLMDAWPRKE